MIRDAGFHRRGHAKGLVDGPEIVVHLEYLEQHLDGYRYTQFWEFYRRWLRRRGLSMRRVHHAGAKLFVDYAGTKLSLIDPSQWSHAVALAQLLSDALRLWRQRSWIFPRDPAFAIKVERILELRWALGTGFPLGPREYVLSADEKSSIQARLPIHPSLAPTAERPIYVEHEFERSGACGLSRRVGCASGQGVRPVRGDDGHRAPFARLVAQVMTHEPYRSARPRVLGRRQRVLPPRRAHPGAVARHLAPRHSRPHAGSRQLDQPDRDLFLKVLTPKDFAFLAEVEDRLLRFQDRYQRAAAPFQWTEAYWAHLYRAKAWEKSRRSPSGHRSVPEAR